MLALIIAVGVVIDSSRDRGFAVNGRLLLNEYLPLCCAFVVMLQTRHAASTRTLRSWLTVLVIGGVVLAGVAAEARLKRVGVALVWSGIAVDFAGRLLYRGNVSDS